MTDPNEAAFDKALNEPPAARPSAEAVAALASYQQADQDGVMVLVSRQAIDECLPFLRAPLSEPPAALLPPERKALVERLRRYGREVDTLADEAANALEAQAARIAGLRERADEAEHMLAHTREWNTLSIIRYSERTSAAEARAEAMERALRPLLSDKARKLLTDHANAAHVMGDRDYRAIADAIRMLLDKDEKARAALAAQEQGGEHG
jgi:hypothetical protein